jgi:hypothetical protein
MNLDFIICPLLGTGKGRIFGTIKRSTFQTVSNLKLFVQKALIRSIRKWMFWIKLKSGKFFGFRRVNRYEKYNIYIRDHYGAGRIGTGAGPARDGIPGSYMVGRWETSRVYGHAGKEHETFQHAGGYLYIPA